MDIKAKSARGFLAFFLPSKERKVMLQGKFILCCEPLCNSHNCGDGYHTDCK